MKTKNRAMRHRYEQFGGIVASEDPPFLAYVDRELMRELGLPESPAWDGPEEPVDLLSAPTEIHLSATNACRNRCPHCYMDSGELEEHEMDTARFKEALTALAEWGVFHVALGGGEALLRDDLFELAEHARAVGLVPNLTVSGSIMTPEIAARMAVFGQVNLSLDGVGELSGAMRGKNVFAEVDRAIRMLIGAGVATGINCVLGRRNFDGLAALFEYAAGVGLNEVELLRYKPSGRAAGTYGRERTTYEQNVALLPRVTELGERAGVTAKIDCSFVPMMCYHRPPQELLEKTATYGCEAGNVLLGARADGRLAGCSFLETSETSIFEARAVWRTDPSWNRLRRWPDNAPPPCRGCDYLAVCKGGCHAVAAAVTGSMDNPDPDCPWVVEKGEGSSSPRSSPQSGNGLTG